MLSVAVNTLEYFSPTVVAASNILVFLGAGYIALHSRVMPKWAVTCLWYLGLACLLNLITFFVEWGVGQSHPLSHFQIGVVTETLVHLILSLTVCLLFLNTVWKDYTYSKLRYSEKPVARNIKISTRKKINTAAASLKKAAPRKTIKTATKKPSASQERLLF